MAQRELEGSIYKAHTMRLANDLQGSDAGKDVVGGGVVVVKRAGFRPGGEDARVIGATDDDAHAALQGQWQEAVQRCLLQQGVAPGQQEQVEIATLNQPLAGLPCVHPRAEGLDYALVAQLQQGAVAARHEFAQTRVQSVLAAMVGAVEIMSIEDVDAVKPGALQRGIKAAQHAVIAVVIHLAPGGHVEPLADAIALFGRAGAQMAADLGRKDVTVSRFSAQEMVQPGL